MHPLRAFKKLGLLWVLGASACGGGPPVVAASASIDGVQVRLTAGIFVSSTSGLSLELTSVPVSCADASFDFERGPYFKQRGIQVVTLWLFKHDADHFFMRPTSPARFAYQHNARAPGNWTDEDYLLYVDQECKASFPQAAAFDSGWVELEVVDPPAGSFEFVTRNGERLAGTFGALTECSKTGDATTCH